ncbi:DNA protecting protein DprA [Yoonia maricola]|uniref:DNA protecting protein DprA n=1 Tax=Yoonia maricola TaxID=420999 RepID=A0A2M8WP96_9RHOB|nr:DNA-processing protein DprA [Yoonia maricola]PJI92759.1 DNA protecting protein DprA [Yoonia maricola]
MTGTHLSSNHPPLLPTTEEDAVNHLRLLRSRRVGVATYRRLLAEHGSAADALKALPDVAKAAGVTDYAVCPEGVVMAELKAGKSAGARLLLEGAPDYPNALQDVGNAPPILWALGDTELLQKPMIALVGARNASSLGTRMAKRLGEDLTKAGFAVVSGLARGIDAAAHHGALAGGTVAVMAGGVDVIYPAENTQLAHDIAKRGLRLAEMPMGLQPQARHFPARNRIISALSRAVVVVEAAAKSGSLITARNALDQGRDVMAVPGHPFDARAWGSNMLIRDGADLVRNAQDVIDAVTPVIARPPEPDVQTPAKDTRSLRDIAALHSEILSRLGTAPIAEDQLLRDIKARATDVAPILVDLELAGKIARQSGGLLARVE